MKMLILLMVSLLSSQTSPPVSDQGLKPVPDTVGVVGVVATTVAVTRCEDLQLLILVQQGLITAQREVVAIRQAAYDDAEAASAAATLAYQFGLLNEDPNIEALYAAHLNGLVAKAAALGSLNSANDTLAVLIDQLEALLDEWNDLECEGEISP